jgi:hypothetical protein|nr:MAG TPA: helix-turn-helix domain protein [Caudoviricetes sp.]
MDKIEIRTPFEIKRDERNAKIRELYPQIVAENPGIAFNRVATIIAKMVGCTANTVKNFAIAEGYYTPKKRLFI